MKARKSSLPKYHPDTMWLDGFVDGARLVPDGDDYISEERGFLMRHDASALLRVPFLDYGEKLEEGWRVTTPRRAWHEIRKQLLVNPDFRFKFSKAPRRLEELVAGAYVLDGAQTVVLTPRSGDRGRDVIAYQHGWNSIRVIDEAKAYSEGRIVRWGDVRAFSYAVLRDLNCSKGIITTTSRFPLRLPTSFEFSAIMPYRLQLRNGERLLEWLASLPPDSTAGK